MWEKAINDFNSAVKIIPEKIFLYLRNWLKALRILTGEYFNIWKLSLFNLLRFK